MIPAYKKGDKRLPGNYRPVSLSSVPYKTLETPVNDQLMDYLTLTGLLSPEQYDFRTRRPCTTQLLEALGDWTKMENDDPVDALCLEFRKAFDSVPHERLLTKLSAA